MTEPQWKVEKAKILKLSLEDKRKLYKNKDILPLHAIDPWPVYFLKNQSITARKPNVYDIIEWQKSKHNETLDEDLIRVLGFRVSLIKSDITKLEVDAIVNTTSSMLVSGGAIDTCIHAAAGHHLQEECMTMRGCPPGDARITGGYNLPAKYVIHTVGPRQGTPSAVLESCYEKCLSYHKTYNIRSIAFPCISTGFRAYPKRVAAHAALRAVRKFLETNESLERIIFCTYMPVDVHIYETLMQLYFPMQEWNYNDGETTTDSEMV